MFPKSWLARLVILIIAMGMLLGACGGAYAPDEPPEAVYLEREVGVDSAASLMSAPMEMQAEEMGYDDEYGVVTYVNTQSAERLVIKNADLTVVVSDPSGSMDAIARMAEEMGGFVVSANLYHVEMEGGLRVPHASISIRVPAEHLNEALDRIKGESDQDPLSESISSQDVTSEYVDLQSRLGNLEAAEAQLQEIMDDAVKTEDVLSVYNELVRVRGEIEIIKGRMQYLEQSAALSAIHTELIPDEAVQPLTIGGWQPAGVVKSAVQALINGLKFLANLGIWILVFVLPIALILMVLVFLPIRWIVRWARRRKADNRKESVSEGRKDTPEAQE